MNEAQERIESKINFSLFFPQVVCPECGKGWDHNDLTDYFKKFSGIKSFPAGEYVGKSLKTMWEAYQKKTDAEYHMPDNHRLSNKKYIDNSFHPNYVNIKINPSGYHPNVFGTTNPEHILEEGDQVEFWLMECFHKTCLQVHLDTQAKEGFMAMFEKAGFQKYQLQTIPNEACRRRNCTTCAAWFLVTTEYGVFKIGWSKYLVFIAWPEGKDCLHLFEDQHATKNSSFIYAYGKENAITYLRKMCKALLCLNI